MTERGATRAWLWWSIAGFVVTFGVLVVLSASVPAQPSIAATWAIGFSVERTIRQYAPRSAPDWLLAVAYTTVYIGAGLVVPAPWSVGRDGFVVGLVLGVVLILLGVALAWFANRYVGRQAIEAEIERYHRSVDGP